MRSTDIMSWIKLDDRMPDHRKVVGLSDRAFRAHIEALCYAAGNLTDGAVPAAVARAKRWTRSAGELVDAGLWEPHDSGWLIHDYLEHQRSRESAEELSKTRAKVGSVGGKQSAKAKQVAKQTASKTQADQIRERSEPQKPTASSVPRGSQRTITDDYRRQMHARYGHVWTVAEIDERIAEALNHKAVLKARDVSLYVNGWLRRDAERTTGGRAPNGVVGAGANVQRPGVMAGNGTRPGEAFPTAKRWPADA